MCSVVVGGGVNGVQSLTMLCGCRVSTTPTSLRTVVSGFLSAAVLARLPNFVYLAAATASSCRWLSASPSLPHRQPGLLRGSCGGVWRWRRALDSRVRVAVGGSFVTFLVITNHFLVPFTCLFLELFQSFSLRDHASDRRAPIVIVQKVQ